MDAQSLTEFYGDEAEVLVKMTAYWAAEARKVNVEKDDPRYEYRVLVQRLITEFRKKCRGDRTPATRQLATMQELLSFPPERQAKVVAALLGTSGRYIEIVAEIDKAMPGGKNPILLPGFDEVDSIWRFLWDALKIFLRRKLPLSVELRMILLEWCALLVDDNVLPVSEGLRIAESLVAECGKTPEIRSLIHELRAALEKRDSNVFRREIAHLKVITAEAIESPLKPGEAWSDMAIGDVGKLPGRDQLAWKRLLTHCRETTGAAPPKQWLTTARSMIGEINEATFRTHVTRWLAETAKPRTHRALSDIEWAGRCVNELLSNQWDEMRGSLRDPSKYWTLVYKWIEAAKKSGDVWGWLGRFTSQPEVKKAYLGTPPQPTIPPSVPAYDAAEDKLIAEPHMDILRGVAWACGLFPSPELARALTALALSAYRKVPGRGPRAVRVGNACITALAMMGGLDAVGQLAVLKVKVKFGTAQIAIEKALTTCAEKSGIPRDELEEMSVPAYGLTEVGRLVETLGDCSAELRIVDSREVALIFRGADGKERKSLPAAVKEQFREELKELSAAKKDIEKMLPAQAERLDALFLAQKSWTLEPWLERYAGHPLVGALARRLIWNFTTGGVTTPGVWLDGKLTDRTGTPVPLDAKETRVTLWHPLDQKPDDVLGWRIFLEERKIRQPFKQAHREIYLLTPAEAQTVTYSNRFAAHLLRQHQFNALCAARGWKNKLRLMVDDSYPPASRELRGWGLRAEFWIEGAGDNYGTNTNEAGTFHHVATDQVRIYRADAAQLTAHAGGGGYGPGWREPVADEPLRLADVPPLVFSEIMRDVDLFVGVASVGNDPAWADGGRREAERGAWGRFAFGDLSATAKTRRDVLERLVPKLKIAAQCSFEEKFLVVRGKLRTYKIHLGSGNILMSPNDQYLCIVASRGKAEPGNLFLPFEGDGVLSVVLSKALLLAADDKITDESITRQIR